MTPPGGQALKGSATGRSAFHQGVGAPLTHLPEHMSSSAPAAACRSGFEPSHTISIRHGMPPARARTHMHAHTNRQMTAPTCPHTRTRTPAREHTHTRRRTHRQARTQTYMRARARTHRHARTHARTPHTHIFCEHLHQLPSAARRRRARVVDKFARGSAGKSRLVGLARLGWDGRGRRGRADR